jgi:hypothetical protein
MREHGSYEKAIAIIREKLEGLKTVSFNSRDYIEMKETAMVALSALIKRLELEIDREIHEEERRA